MQNNPHNNGHFNPSHQGQGQGGNNGGTPNPNPHRVNWGNLVIAIFLAFGTVSALNGGDSAFTAFCLIIAISLLGLQLLRIWLGRQ